MSFKDRLVQQPAIATALGIQRRYRDDAADQLAAAISFFGFVSVFPLLTLALAGAGGTCSTTRTTRSSSPSP